MADLKYWNIPAIDKGMNTALAPEQIQPNEAAYVNGVQFGPGYFENRPGFQLLGDPKAGVWPLSGTVRYLDTVTWGNGTATTLAICQCPASYDKIYKLSGEVWVVVDCVAAVHGWGSTIGVAMDSNYVGSAPMVADYWRAENGHEAYFFAGNSKVFKYSESHYALDSGATVLGQGVYDAATGSGYWNESTHNAHALMMYDYRLWLGGTGESTGMIGYRLRYSDVDNPHRFTTINYIDLIEAPYRVQALGLTGDNLVCYTSPSIVEVRRTGTPGTPYGKTVTQVSNGGNRGPRGVALTSPRAEIFLGSNNVYTYQQGGLLERIGDKVALGGRLPQVVWGSTGRAVLAPRWGSGRYIYIAFPMYSDKFFDRASEVGDTRNHGVFIYDTWYKTWSFMEVPAIAIGFSGATTGLTWDTIEGTWLEQRGTWADAYTGGGEARLLLADKDGYIYVLNPETTIDEDTRYPQDWECEFESAKWRPPVGEPLQAPQPGQLYRFQEIIIHGTMQDITMTLTTDEGTYTVEPDFEDDVWRHRNCDLRGEWLQMSLHKAGSSAGAFRVYGIALGYDEDGTREASA